MDYIDFCKKYYATTKIPISLLLGTAGKYSTIGELISVEPLTDYPVLAGGPNPSIHFYSSEIIYGCICIEETDYVIILGPIFECPVTPSQINLFMQESAVPAAYREQIVEFLYTIPTTSRLHLARHLSLLHLILNRKNADIPEILEISFGNTVNRNSHNVEQFIENKENEELHSTHYMELELYEHIRNGNPKKLADFLKSTPLNLNEKKLAKSPLRQAKNIFISTVTNVGMIGAIPGGVDVERTYHLMDMYIQECEQLQTLKEINDLQYQMLFDFCEKAGETHIPSGISADIYACMNYIRSHTNEAIRLEDVAAHIDRSTSFIAKKFKSELGFNPGAYISRCKLEEANSLLTFTEKSLTEISNYLCYSSQAHFQTAFKKKYGMTPRQYRNKTQQI